MRESGAGLLLPRLIPVGDPELDDRIGGALEPVDDAPIPPAIDRLERSLTLASIVRGGCASSAEALRLSADLARALDALEVEEIDPRRLREAVGEASDLASHWEHALEKLQLIVEQWPGILAEHGAIDLTERRNRVLRRVAERWKSDPPPGSPSPRESPRPLRQWRRWSAGSRACLTGWSCFRACGWRT